MFNNKIISVLIWLLLISTAFAQVPMTGAGVGVSTLYKGPLDVYGIAKGIWLLRAASTADRGNRLINICNVADVACADWSSSTTTGKITPITVGVTDCTAVTTCTVKTIYDRSGATACTGTVACDVTNTTIANRPTFIWNGGNPYLLFSLAASQRLCTTVNIAANIAQPLTVSWVGLRSSGTGFQETLAQSGAQLESGFANAANSLLMYAGLIASISATDGNFYAVQSVYNAAASTFYVNGSGPSTVSTGTNAFVNTLPFCIGGTQGSSNLLNGQWRESGVWATAESIGNQTILNIQQRTFWGF